MGKHLTLWHRYPSLTPSVSLIPTRLHSSLMLVIASQRTSMHPLSHSTVSYPCTVCSREVKWGANALWCEDCDRWTHAACLDLAHSIYTELGQSDNLWFCPDCGLPNHSDLNNDMYSVPVHNPFEALERNITLEDLTKLYSTLDSDTSLLIPQSASTPVQCSDVQQPSRKVRKLSRSTLKTVNINCQSIMAHKDHIGVLIDSVCPNIILGTKTWLDPSVTTPSDLSDYNVEWFDRNRHGGRVFVAIKDSIIMSREYDLEFNDCELLWCKINLARSKLLHVGSY